MHILWTLLIGFVVGVIAKLLMPGNKSLGIIMTTILGIIGSVLGTFIGQALGWYSPGQPAGFIASVFGALIVLFIAKRFAK